MRGGEAAEYQDDFLSVERAMKMMMMMMMMMMMLMMMMMVGEFVARMEPNCGHLHSVYKSRGRMD
jgi:hypothetical protein